MDIDTYLPQFKCSAYYEWEQLSDWDSATDKATYTWTPVLLLNAHTPDDAPFVVNRIPYRVAHAHVKIQPGRSNWPSAQIYRAVGDYAMQSNVTPAAGDAIRTRISEIFKEIADGDRTAIQMWQRNHWLSNLDTRIAAAITQLSKASNDLELFRHSNDFMPPHEVTQVR